MDALPVQGERKHCGLSKEGPSPESSLTWCLAHLSKPSSRAEGKGKLDPGGGRDVDKRSRVGQWRALVAIRTQHIKGDKAGITRFRTQGGLQPLLDLLRLPECSRKTLDLALSILANCCTEPETRAEVRELDGINIVVDILKRNMALETVQNRAARALGNLAMDSESSSLIHSAGGVPLLLLCVSLSSAPSSPTAAPSTDPCPKLECAQSAARALLYLSDTPSNRLALLTQGTLSALAPLIAPEYPQSLRRAALRTLHELTRGCGAECAREVSRSGVLAQLGVMALGGKPFEELALKTLANMCSQGCLRPLVGSLGVIQKFTKEVEKDPLRSGVFLKALCLCCKEAVNRAKVKESGGLEVLIGFLSAHQSHPLSRLAILACVDFVFDESAMEHLQELGLVPLLVARLASVTGGEEQSADKMDVGVAACVSPTDLVSASCLDSFDFPPPDGYKKEEAGREHGLCSSSFLSLRSWLVSEGLISSEGDLLESSASVDGEWGGPHVPPSSSSPTCDTNSSLKNAAKSSNQPGCSSVSSPSKTPLVSPSKFSSPHRRRQRAHSAAGVTKVTLDTPPPVPRPAYQHPYHPEPWTPESPILLLLSRFSHASDPSAALVTSGAVSSLLQYLTQHQDPSSRCFRMLCRLTCNPNCLQALVRTGSVALIHHHLCQRDGASEEPDRQTARVKAKVRQLGLTLLNNLRVQSESGFGSGVLAHVMLSGSESDRMNCALCLPLISSNKPLLKKLLVDCGGLLLALQPLGCDDDHVDEPPAECAKSNWIDPSGVAPQLHSLYFSVLIGCLSTLMGGTKSHADKRDPQPADAVPACRTDTASPPPLKRPRRADVCPYSAATFDLLLKLDDGTQIPASRGAVGGLAAGGGVGSEYFRALLTGGFGESQANADEAIHIRDVSAGMLLPVLHYLHGCRITTCSDSSREERGPCRVLDSVVLSGLGCGQVDGEDLAFHRTPLGEMMTGACRFLVTELQRELEDLCVSLLLTCSVKEQQRQESAEENLAHRTSELELTGFEAPMENPSGQDRSGGGGGGGGVLPALLPQVYWFSQQYSYPAVGRACLSLLLGRCLSSSLAADCLRRVARELDGTDTLKQDIVTLATAALS